MPPIRSKEVYCKCKSYCTTWNPVSQRYEGHGEPIPRSTRDRHSAEDRRRFQSGQATAPTLNTSSPAHQDWITSVQSQIMVVSSLPLTFPGKPFEFLHNPSEAWPYCRATSPHELLVRNRSPCSLKENYKYNAPCLDAERQLLDLYSIVTLFRSDAEEEGRLAMEMILDGLMRIDWEKEVQWSEQRQTLVRGYHSYNTDMFFNARPRVTATITTAMLSVLVLHHVYFSTRRTAWIHLATLRDILRSTSVPAEELETLP
ncbi:hypothetical protein BJ165DRAFT_1533486 [Panaeolus papilionaceus]|nr:hypothetical protein BJ165DRAFT_1533486 [Panaeolus papilionaceus]